MIKVIALLYKNPGFTDEEFYKRWQDWAPLAAERVPGLRKYVQNHMVRTPGVLCAEGDGFAELWFDDVAAYKKWLAWFNARGDKEVADKSDDFRDRSKIIRWVVEEHFIK